MARIFRLLSVPALLGGLFWQGAALAQSGDVVDDEGDKGEESSASDESEEKSDEDSGNEGDGGWESDSGGGSTGVHFGLRLAYGIPFGKRSGSQVTGANGQPQDDKFNDAVLGQIPIWLDLGWQATPSFMVGVYFSYGFGLLTSDQRDACDARKVSCRISDLRLGLQVQYGFSPGQSANPWIGAGVGYEWFTSKAGDDTATLRGFELPLLQGGVDFGGDSRGSTFGPFVAFSRGVFDHYSTKQGSQEDSGSFSDVNLDTADHYWLFLGIRGVVN